MTTLRATLEGTLRYRGREGQWSYILNRISGLATLLFLTLHILDTATVYFFPNLYNHAIDLYRTTGFMIGEIALVAAVLYHGLTGYKIIVFDQRPERWTESNERRAFWLVVSLSFVLWLPAATLMGRSLYLHNVCRCPPAEEAAVQIPAWANVAITLVLAAAVIYLARTVSLRIPPGGTRRNFDTWMWLFMRWSGVLLVPLVWIHVLINDVLVGVHAIDLNYVDMRWAMFGWRAFDVGLLSFTFAHGINGLRNVMTDYLHRASLRALANRVLLVVWVLWTMVGAVAVVGGVRVP